MAHETILIVEDEKDIAEMIVYNLNKEGYKTHISATGEEALAQTALDLPDLILLDLMLPGVDGLEVCQRLKQEKTTRSVPVVMLTAKGEDSDIVAGLEIGADDYVTKPFSPKVLIARIRAVLRRIEQRQVLSEKEQFEIHQLHIDVPRHQVHCAGNSVDLSASEFGILLFLSRNPGWVFSRSQIISAVKGEDYPVTERSVDVQILGLRKKLGQCGAIIETVRGIGYRLQQQESQRTP